MRSISVLSVATGLLIAEKASAQGFVPGFVLCKGNKLGPNEKLETNEYLCAPDPNGGNDSSTRFGLNFMGMPQLFINGELKWWAQTRGEFLKFQEKDSHFVLYGEGISKWETNCYGDAEGKEVVFEEGQIKVYDANDALVWNLSSDSEGEFVESNCYPQLTEDAEEGEEKSAETTASSELHPLNLLGTCRGKSLKAGESLKPGEFLCNPKDDKVNKFGLNFMGMPQLFHDGKLVWHAAARGTNLVFQDDSNVVLIGEGMVKWATQCYGRGKGRELKFAKGGIVAIDEDKNLVWRMKSNGVSTDCYPFLQD